MGLRRAAWIIFVALNGALVATAGATTIEERSDLDVVFQDAGVVGTFVLFDAALDRYTMVNRNRANARFIPASTFKIAHSLIALETGAVRDTDEVIPYGGMPQPIEAWERDMSMREAIIVSNFAVYQQIARRVGRTRMAAMLERLGYGNRSIGKEIATF